MDLMLQGLRALVTGASRGLGYATALGLAGEGVAVALNSRSIDSLHLAADRIREKTGRTIAIFPGDITDPDIPARLVGEAAGAFGGLDLLVTNTSGPPSGPFDSFDDGDWQRAVELFLLSHVCLIRAAMPYLRQSKTGLAIEQRPGKRECHQR